MSGPEGRSHEEGVSMTDAEYYARLRADLERWNKQVKSSDRTPATKRSYLYHADFFVRWATKKAKL
jgi:hypothetical protein